MKTRYLLPLLCCMALIGAACGDDTAGVPANSSNEDTGNNAVVDMGPDEGNNDDSPDMSDDGDGACTTNADCTEPEVCVYDPMTGEGTCGDPPGDGETGDMCTTGTDCRSGLCIDGLCADPCAGEQDCPAGYTCQATDIDLEGGGTATVDVCVPEITPCSANNDCSDPDICVVDRSGDDVALQCDAPVGGGMLGDDCTEDGDCASNLCLSEACTEPCETANDCADDGSYVCETETVMTDTGAMADVTVCNPRPADTCISDGDCGGGDRCIANTSATDIEFRCGEPNAGGGETGADCADDSECAQNLCIDGVCQGPCAEVGDCATGEDFDCEVTNVDLGNGNTDSAQICVPPIVCDEDDDCPAADNEVCYIRENPDTLDTLCRDPNVGGGNLGQVCSGRLECANNFCLPTRFRDVCATPCVDDTDCARAGYECRTHTAELDGGGTADIDLCLPETPPACTSNDDCGTNLDCAIIVNEAGDGLESVCVPTTGGDATGVACQLDSDCASLLCLNGFCADPCEDSNHCGQDQVCQSNNVTKDGQTDTFDVCETLPDVQCASTDDCTSGLRVCGELRDNMGTTEAYCTFPNAGGDQLGTTCDDSANCRENICLGDFFVYPGTQDPVAPECTVVCDEDVDCDATQLCTTWGDVNMCTTACADNDDCAADGRVCTTQGDALADEVDQICAEPWGDGILGAMCAGPSECETGLCLRTLNYTNTSCTDDAGCDATLDETCECPIDEPNCTTGKLCATTERRCTNLCNDAGDCTGGVADNPLTACSQDTVTQTPGGTSVTISTCAQN